VDRGLGDEPACKPDSVSGLAVRRRPSICDRRCRRPGAAYPQARTGSPRTPAQTDSFRCRSFWPCSGWGLPSRSSHLDRWWSLTPPFHPCRCRSSGGLFSVALSRGSPRVGVTHHPALRSPDFPRQERLPRPPGRLVLGKVRAKRAPGHIRGCRSRESWAASGRISAGGGVLQQDFTGRGRKTSGAPRCMRSGGP
jgi:hypothetical protein